MNLIYETSKQIDVLGTVETFTKIAISPYFVVQVKCIIKNAIMTNLKSLQFLSHTLIITVI